MTAQIVKKRGPIDFIETDKFRWEPQRTNHFELVVEGMDADFPLVVNTFGLPNVTNDPIEVAHGNSRKKFAGQTAFGGADSLEVTDYVGYDTEQQINDWRLQVYDPHTDTIGLAFNYKRAATVTEYSPDRTRLRVWHIEGLWPSGVAYGDSLTNDGSDVKKITLTMAYDRAYRDRDAGALHTSNAEQVESTPKGLVGDSVTWKTDGTQSMQTVAETNQQAINAAKASSIAQ